MYSRFKLNLAEDFSAYYKQGLRLYNQNRAIVEGSLDSFLTSEHIDGSRLQEHWFPQIKTDIFLSHSHRDESIAIGLAGWLNEQFDLNLFIDSCVWGYADDLLKLIDDDYCVNPGSNTYSYQKRNGSTSHVHMMLNTALSKMIDNSECLFFLNTPNSITSEEAITKTKSPWLYSEIAISEIMRYKTPQAHRGGSLSKIGKLLLENENYRSSLNIEYDINLQNMKEINKVTLTAWAHHYFATVTKKHPLDCLYEICK
ncbi:MAG: hypothetical protein M0R31_11120 [Candidatus Riflebacteria bacterium]|jgi:hypothetical protein|nr:hypothetical protein [Candidatus Riflebacteria bacterium]